ncbi:MAG: GNAT family N-acetyltransferase [Micromonosporaceae bacterium]|nr:GNAT family N-acetyltransferase [Micromonosporaceae bacterium]
MSEPAVPTVAIRTAVAADLPALRRVYRTASLSNAGDAPVLLARPEYLDFPGDAVAAGRTRVAVAGPPGAGRVVGFVTVIDGDDGPELEDLFVDPQWRRRGFARHLVLDVVTALQQAGRRRLWVTGNPHALGFYLAVGFVETGRVATELGTGLRMYLDLTRG